MAVDVISGLIVEPTGMFVRGKVGDSRLNSSRDIETASLCDERTTTPAHNHVRPFAPEGKGSHITCIGRRGEAGFHARHFFL